MRGLIAVLALGASMCTSAPSGPTRYVNLEKDAHGERRALPFWVSSDAMQHCLEQGLRGLNAGTEARQAFDGAACADGRIGDLAHGTAVEALASSPECGALAKVRVLEGEHQGRVGCVPPEVLGPDRMP
ncbi:MAG: hypothetical protein E6J55_23465 [Deltaproteobacteria bacterium]|nr:MAG: hypothetical protein E6J55_23465 [Deltaproteobacteria bacterium]